MSYYRISQRTIVFDHLEKTSIPKTWVHIVPGTLIVVTKHPVQRLTVPVYPPGSMTWQQRAEFTVLDGPAAGFRGETWLFDATPLSALEILAEAADE